MTRNVSLVIPGRNCAGTIEPCLAAVAPMLDHTPLDEIIFVDDGSTDQTVQIARKFPVTVLEHPAPKGPGAARNLGWRTARNELVWFVDADCVAQPDALTHLLPAMENENAGGISGSYGIMNPHSLLARLIHEEIIQRHLRMGDTVDFLATFNVLYRKKALEQVGGFDERFLKGQDAELSFRVTKAGYTLHFNIDSRVKHFHETGWLKYLNTQKHQGYWRVFLHLNHAGHAGGDSYSSALDHLQPPLAMCTLATLPLAPFGRLALIPAALAVLLALAQLPLALRITARTKRTAYLLFAAMSFARAFWRGWGMTRGTLAWLTRRHAKLNPRQDPST